MRQDLEAFLKAIIDRLTDIDVDAITDETTIDELDLVSLDFVTIKVEAKNKLGMDIDLNALAEAELDTFGELMDYLEKNYLKEK
ncbi:phosphopantetheine binding protein [Serratia fonticola]|uniref:Phosphopantetheine binding protein n=1 Tax=Serratia fonticola TaxID=47917 RepID=A0A542BPT6_SERFO|nr:acyl carrier protein [Serratia fonticola]TQI80565.1 phosphopantetheine binding protein [Serratia fonticola]TQI97410.1 phosphopantetheine binding protein [Serratia fonticola]TVZ71906.1 phosphopantetheine binding protein [Serratia fonticola]